MRFPPRFTLTLIALTALASLFLAVRPQLSAAPDTVAELYLPELRCPDCSGVSASPTATSELTPTPTATPEDDPEELRAIELANQARTAAGCPAATVHPALMRATRAWSQYMLDSGTSHHAPQSHYDAFGYSYGGLENIGGALDAESMISRWLNSPPHQSNMLWCAELDPENPSYNPDTRYEIGIGRAGDYWTLRLGIRTD